MRIGIEACTWSNRRGYGRFVRQLITAMIDEFPQHDFTLLVDRHTADESTFPERATIVVIETSAQPTQAASADGARSVGDLRRMGRAVKKLPVDVFFFPTRYTFFPVFGAKMKIVTAFHDATAERHPELIFPGFRSRMMWRLKTWLALRQSDRLVTVSEDARRQLADVFNRDEASIGVITEGPDACFRTLNDNVDVKAVRARYGLPASAPLVIYVGGISPHKNLDGLLKAMAMLPDRPWHLALVGEYEKDSFLGCHRELVRLAGELGLKDRITFTGYVPDEDLVALHNDATLLVLPLFSEGFGLPVVEAMACGLPVAASNRNSIPEVLGSAGLLFDPESHAEIADAVGRLLSDEDLCADLSAKGLQRAKLFSWTAGAHKMMAILEDVVRGS